MNYPSPPRQPTRTKASRHSSSWLAGLIWFVVLTTVGVATLAAAVLLPEYAALAELETKRVALAHQIDCEGKLALYNGRIIDALETDPVLTGRLMIRHANYRPLGCRPIDVHPSLLEQPPPNRILRQATQPPAPPGPLRRAGQWLGHRPTRAAMVILGLGILCLGAVLFIGPTRRCSPAATARPQRPDPAQAFEGDDTVGNADEVALIHPVVIHMDSVGPGSQPPNQPTPRRLVSAANGGA